MNTYAAHFNLLTTLQDVQKKRNSKLSEKKSKFARRRSELTRCISAHAVTLNCRQTHNTKQPTQQKNKSIFIYMYYIYQKFAKIKRTLCKKIMSACTQVDATMNSADSVQSQDGTSFAMNTLKTVNSRKWITCCSTRKWRHNELHR